MTVISFSHTPARVGGSGEVGVRGVGVRVQGVGEGGWGGGVWLNTTTREATSRTE